MSGPTVDESTPGIVRPRPSKAFFGPRANRTRRGLSRVVAAGNRALAALPPCRWWYRWTLRSLEVAVHRFELPGLGAGLDGARIAFLSDLHVGSYLGRDDLAAVVERVMALDPDVVCLGGDLINTRPAELDPYREVWADVRPPFGSFAVPGNHEHFWTVGPEQWQAALKAAGIEVLLNRGVRLERGGASLWLAGVDEWSEGRPDLGAALAGRRDREPAVLLSHHPDLFLQAVGQGVGLTLSGHTHGGQIRPFGWVPMRHSEHGFLAGWYRREGQALYVGRGVGATIVPLRWGARPEIPVFELRAGDTGPGGR